ncbi:hypothetical protein EHS25_000550 [Saitozyma podzolica]|uniref:Uncharacterized protein n=1 Tax=Saitozyma podzolica TaxID=1890683 RepID=A0A427YWF7_9TREE|nr:hypothetical protein EHS25_000550 [Saitozyma podzolica]
MSRSSWDNVRPECADDEIIVITSEDGSEPDDDGAGNSSYQTMLFQHAVNPSRDLDILCAMVTSQRGLDTNTRAYADEIYMVGSEAAEKIRQIVESGDRRSNADEMLAYNEETFAEAVDALFHRVYPQSQRSAIIRDVARVISVLTTKVPLNPRHVADSVSAALRLVSHYRKNSRYLGEKLAASESELSHTRGELSVISGRLQDILATNQSLFDNLTETQSCLTETQSRLSVVKSDAKHMYQKLREEGIDPLR